MPTITVNKQQLFDLLGKTYSTKEFDELCFQFGIELDEDTTEEALKVGAEPELKIDICANRYDLLCIEGLAQSLNQYLGRTSIPTYKLSKPTTQLIIDESTESIRPFAAAAILRNVSFTKESYESFIALQDKLHVNICRNRTLVAMGTHDLDTIEGPFHYKALPPKEISFTPLNSDKEFNAVDLIQFYKTPEQKNNLGKYVHIIEDSPVYPVILDSKDRVCSMPPLINSDRSKISQDSKNIFIELTATDKTKLEIVLDQLVAMFSRYCKDPFVVEPVEIVSPHNGQSRITPDFKPRTMDISIEYINNCLGLELTPKEIQDCLKKMALIANHEKDSTVLTVTIPVTRSDILHPCDIMEDVAIGYGFNNLPIEPHQQITNTEFFGTPLPINKVSDIFRMVSAQATWLEVLPLTLCSHAENFEFLRKKDDGNEAVQIANPKTMEYQVVRTSLLPGILKTVRENRKHSLPIKVFETGDVVFKDEKLELKSYNQRNWAAIQVGMNSGFEIIQGLLGKVMQAFRTPWLIDFGKNDKGRGYWIEETQEHGMYFNGRGANVMFRPKEGAETVCVGSIGVLHPEVMQSFEVPYAASYVELNAQVFL